MPYKDKSRQREYGRKFVAERKAAWLHEHGPCHGCGSWLRLEVHHKDPSTKVTHRVWSLTRTKRDEELKKCEPLCHDCHKEATKAQRPWKHNDGGYHKHKCRCEICREAHRRHLARRDRKKKPAPTSE